MYIVDFKMLDIFILKAVYYYYSFFSQSKKQISYADDKLVSENKSYCPNKKDFDMGRKYWNNLFYSLLSGIALDGMFNFSTYLIHVKW